MRSNFFLLASSAIILFAVASYLADHLGLIVFATRSRNGWLSIIEDGRKLILTSLGQKEVCTTSHAIASKFFSA